MPWIAATANLADEPSLANGTPHTTAKMTGIPLHKTWQMNLPSLMKPQYQSRDGLHTTTQLLAYEPTLANVIPVPEQIWLAYHYTKLGRWTYFAWTQWQMFESSSTHHFWETSTAFSQNTCFSLRKWPPFIPRAPEIPTSSFSGVQWTQWQRFESSQHSPFLRYPTAFSQNTFLLRTWLSFLPTAPEIPTSNFSGVINTMAKVWKLLVFRGAEILHCIFPKKVWKL